MLCPEEGSLVEDYAIMGGKVSGMLGNAASI
jgi:hypothetical protein